MAIYKGTAYAVVTSATGNRYFAVRLGDRDLDPATREDGAQWELSASTTALTIQYTMGTDGAGPPGAPNSVEITLYDASTNTVVDTTTITPGTSTWNSVFLYVTTNGSNSGTPRIGDLRLYIRAVRTDIGTYDVNSDTQNTKGIVRVNPTSATVAFTGPAGVHAYPDTQTATLTLSHAFATPRTLSRVTVRRTSDATVYKAADTLPTGQPEHSRTFTVDNAYPAAETVVHALFAIRTSTIAPDSEPTATVIVLPSSGQTADVTVDPRLTVDHHLQVNASTLDPAADRNPKTRLTSDLGFVGFRITNARGEGRNGLSVAETLADTAGLVPAAVSRTVTTATVASQDGWAPTLAPWDSALPGGAWVHTVDVATANATGLEIGPVADYVLLAINPNLRVVVGAGHPSAGDQAGHWSPGDPLLLGAAVFHALGLHLVETDPDPSPSAVIGRFHTGLGRAEYLTATYGWAHLSGNLPADAHALVQSAGDPRVWVTQLPTEVTAGFDHATLFAVVTVTIAGTPYSGTTALEVSGDANAHRGYALDPIGLALSDVLATR